MNIERALRLISGIFILLSVTLSIVHHHNWIYFTAFIGLNLFQSAFTNWCPMMWILEKAGMEYSCQKPD